MITGERARKTARLSRWRIDMATRLEANRTASLQRSDTMKPGSKDRRVSLLIAGDELTALKRLTWLMSESFGLDTRIENYLWQTANRALQLGL
jgi:hypothetical protein